MSKLSFAVIVWRTESEFVSGERGEVYGWYESLATALHTATNVVHNGECWHATAVRAL